MRKRGIEIKTVHDIETAMSYVLTEIAEYDATTSTWGHIPSWLFSDYALDCDNIRKNPGMPFLWHTHDAGTYLHMLDKDIERTHKSYESWKADFLKFDDWEFTELNYMWGESNGRSHPMERIYYYDGDTFREVSRATANLIWQYFGKSVIMEHENVVSVAV